MPSIFVSIASFKDPEIFSTVFDLYDKARNPSRVNLKKDGMTNTLTCLITLLPKVC